MKPILRTLFLPFIFILLVFSCRNDRAKDTGRKQENNYRIPRIAFLTTGNLKGNGQLPAGVVVAHQYFNSAGAVMVIENRNLLLNPEALSGFDILILSSSRGYHDGDKSYSLTYMSEQELEILENWVKSGGTLIAGDNIGRNQEDGQDRISLYGRLTPENWPLSRCFGVTLSERNMKGFQVIGEPTWIFRNVLRDSSESELWTLVPDSICSGTAKVLARWISGQMIFPAFVENRYGKGRAYLLSSSYFLHPTNEGGFMDVDDIEKFYEYVFKQYYEKADHPVKLHPWPGAEPYAFTLTINANGNENQYKRLTGSFRSQKFPFTAFINGQTPAGIVELLKSQKAMIGSNSFSGNNFRDFDYERCISELMANEYFWKAKFSGFRFPFTKTSPQGMLALDEAGYTWESSIGISSEFIYGSVFPYRIPVSADGFYKTTSIYEISPVYNDDYFYFSELDKNNQIAGDRLVKATTLYGDYLVQQLEMTVKKYKGQFTWMGHPAFCGYNDTTITALSMLLEKVKKDKAWITTPMEIVSFRSNLETMVFKVTEFKNKSKITITCPENIKLRGVTLQLSQKPAKVRVKYGTSKLQKSGNQYFLILDAKNNQVAEVEY